MNTPDIAQLSQIQASDIELAHYSEATTKEVFSHKGIVTDAHSDNQFLRKGLDENDDCGYTAFDITRQMAHALLTEQLVQYRDLLAPVVKEQLLQTDFVNYLLAEEIGGVGLRNGEHPKPGCE